MIIRFQNASIDKVTSFSTRQGVGEIQAAATFAFTQISSVSLILANKLGIVM